MTLAPDQLSNISLLRDIAAVTEKVIEAKRLLDRVDGGSFYLPSVVIRSHGDSIELKLSEGFYNALKATIIEHVQLDFDQKAAALNSLLAGDTSRRPPNPRRLSAHERMMRMKLPLRAMQNSWSDTTIYSADSEPVAVLSIEGVATEETQSRLEAAMAVDAEFIVRAANNHDALVDLLTKAAEDVCSVQCPAKWKTSEPQPHGELCKAITAALATAAPRGPGGAHDGA